MDFRLIFYLVWGLGTMLVWGAVLRRSRHAWKLHHDDRARRDLVADLALFLTALLSFVAITMVFFGPLGSGIRGLFAFIAFGAFLAAGVVRLTESPKRDPLEPT